MNPIDFVINYPAVIVTVTSLSAVFLTILTADKAKSRKGYLSDLMMQDRSSMFFMSLGMFIAAVFTPVVIIQFNYLVSVDLKIYSYLSILSSIFFIATVLLLWLDQYALHLIAIRTYILLMFVVQFLLLKDIEYLWLLFGILTLLNIVFTLWTFVRSKNLFFPEIIFSFFTLVYLVLLNFLKNGII